MSKETKPTGESAKTVEADRQLLINAAIGAKKRLIDEMNGGTRNFELMQSLFDEYAGHLYAADMLAGYLDEKGNYKP